MHLSYPVTNKMEEEKTIKQILRNNQYRGQIYSKTINKNLKSKNQNKEDNHSTETKQWGSFTFICRGTRIITKLFKNTDV
jgi:predicted nuclease of restriction endonuclease-like (RecB) superfamily